MHTDYGPSYPKTHDHPTLFFLTEPFPKNMKADFPCEEHELDGLKITFIDLNIMI